MSKASDLILEFQTAHQGHREPANVGTRMNLQSVIEKILTYRIQDDIPPVVVAPVLNVQPQKSESNTIVIDIPDEPSATATPNTGYVSNTTFDPPVTPAIEIKSEAPPITIIPPLHADVKQESPATEPIEYNAVYTEPQTNITTPATAERFTKPQPEVVTSATDAVPEEKTEQPNSVALEVEEIVTSTTDKNTEKTVQTEAPIAANIPEVKESVDSKNSGETITIPGNSFTVTNTEVPVTNVTTPSADAVITPTGEQLDTPISGEDTVTITEVDKVAPEAQQPKSVAPETNISIKETPATGSQQ